MCILRAAGEQLIATLGTHINACGGRRGKCRVLSSSLSGVKLPNPQTQAKTALSRSKGGLCSFPMHLPWEALC